MALPPLPMNPHAAERALERYGLALTAYDLRDLVVQIEAGNPENVKPPWVVYPDGREVRFVHCLGTWVVVAWHRRQRRILTFFPANAEFTDDGRCIMQNVGDGKGPSDWKAKYNLDWATRPMRVS